MSRRLVIAGIAAAALGGAVVPSFASTGAAATRGSNICIVISQQVPHCLPDVVGAVEQTIPQQQGPVTIDTSDGVGVGVALKGQPVAGAHVSPDGQVCVGVSLELPVCTPGVGIATRSHARTQQSLPIPPVTLRHDDNGSAVGVGDVGVIVEKDGTICPVVSTQDWQCIPGN